MGLLTDFRLSVLEGNLGVYGVHVYQSGKTIGEHRFRSDDRENLYSGSKTFASVGVGIAEGEGRFELSDCVLDFFPELQHMAYPGSEKMTIKHLLQMSSGHMFEDFDRFKSGDLAKLFFSMEMKEAAGSRFFYENLCTYMLGRVVEKVSGQTLLDYLKPRLFDPLEIFNPQWHLCPYGHTMAATGLYLTTEEFSRLGIMLLQKGVYKGRQIVAADYVKRMRAEWVDTSSHMDEEGRCGYGYQVWNCTPPNTYRADGMYGQLCVILGDYDAVITVTSHNEGEASDILRAMWTQILPKLEAS
ncbi:MAG TPA: serine hydrolase [Firmicutes bacterium]|nr:serine hydrolase [Bacillota bacterium]